MVQFLPISFSRSLYALGFRLSALKGLHPRNLTRCSYAWRIRSLHLVRSSRSTVATPRWTTEVGSCTMAMSLPVFPTLNLRTTNPLLPGMRRRRSRRFLHRPFSEGRPESGRSLTVGVMVDFSFLCAPFLGRCRGVALLAVCRVAWCVY